MGGQWRRAGGSELGRTQTRIIQQRSNQAMRVLQYIFLFANQPTIYNGWRRELKLKRRRGEGKKKKVDDDIEGRTTAGGTYYQRHTGGYPEHQASTYIHIRRKEQLPQLQWIKKIYFIVQFPTGHRNSPSSSQ